MRRFSKCSRVVWALLASLLFVGGAFALECPPLPPGIRRALETPLVPALPLDKGERVWGGIMPHHDVAGEMIRCFYETLRTAYPLPRRIVLIGPDHFRAGRSPLTLCGADWETEYGALSADGAGVAALAGLMERQDRVFRSEHGITNHLPLIRRYFPGATVLPLIVRNGLSDLHLLAVRKALLSLLGEGGLVLLSMDLSHYKPSAEAMEEDRRTLEALRVLDIHSLRDLDVDCRRGAALFLALMSDFGAERVQLLDHTNSGILLRALEEPCTSYATMLYLR